MARTRTFIGIATTKEIQHRVESLQLALSETGAGVKWVESENLHLTLFFLGEVDTRELMDVCRIVSKATAREAPFELTFRGLGAFPTPRRPKVLWSGIEQGLENLVRIHKAVETPLLDVGAYRREERAFTPHLTLGRVKGEADGELLAEVWNQHQDWDGGRIMVEEVLVYSSEARKQGYEYTVIGRGELLG